MDYLSNHAPWNVGALFESTATPDTIARSAPRAAIHRQGDPCDRVTIAGMVGTTRSRVNAFMKRFTRLGFLETEAEERLSPDGGMKMEGS